MKYIAILVLALLVIGLIAGCGGTNVQEEAGQNEVVSTESATAEAGSTVDSIVIEDTDEVEIGEMI